MPNEKSWKISRRQTVEISKIWCCGVTFSNHQPWDFISYYVFWLLWWWILLLLCCYYWNVICNSGEARLFMGFGRTKILRTSTLAFPLFFPTLSSFWQSFIYSYELLFTSFLSHILSYTIQFSFAFNSFSNFFPSFFLNILIIIILTLNEIKFKSIFVFEMVINFLCYNITYSW